VLRTQGCTQRDIKKILKDKFKVDVLQADVNYIVSKINDNKGKLSEIEKNKILYPYRNYHDTNLLVDYLNNKYGYDFNYSRLIDYASRYGVKKKQQNMYSISKISRQDERSIINLYNQGYSSAEIAEMYGYKTRNSILQKLQKFSVERRDCNELRTLNKSYYGFTMENIDCNEKAYILGLLLTDGFINEQRGYVGLELADRDAIEFIARYVNTKYLTIEPAGKAKLPKYRLILYSRDLLYSVKRLGIVYNKTYVTKGPELYSNEVQFVKYILRGMIDGDGWIRRDGKEFFLCSASYSFIDWCRKVMTELGFISIRVTYQKNNYSGIYLIRTALKYNIDLLKKLVYNKPFGMMRKYDRLYMKDVQRL
jgi:hypothetical protein